MGSSDIMKNVSSVGGHETNHVDEEVRNSLFLLLVVNFAEYLNILKSNHTFLLPFFCVNVVSDLQDE